jgi:hypothetical protein
VATPADLVASAVSRGAQVKKMPSSGVRAPGSAGGAAPAYKAQPKFTDKVGRNYMDRAANPRGITAGDLLGGGKSAGSDAARAAAGGGESAPLMTTMGDGNGTRIRPTPTIQGREVTMGPNGPSITGDNGGTQQLGAAAMRRLGGVPGGGPPPPGPGRGFVPPPTDAPPTDEMIKRMPNLAGFRPMTGGGITAPGDAQPPTVADDLRGALDNNAYERGVPGGPLPEGNDMPMRGAPPPGAGRGFMPPPADADPGMGGRLEGAQGLFDSLGRVGAGLPPNGGVRPRPMPFNRPGAALGGL